MSASVAQHRCTESGFYIHLCEAPNGILDLVLSEQGREQFAEIESIRKSYGSRAALAALLKDHSQNGWEFIPPWDLGALTSAPILSREIERDDEGRAVAVGRVYWFPEFAMLDEIEELRRTGFLEFRGAE